MATIDSSLVGTSVDDIVNQLMALERVNVMKLEMKKSDYESQISMFSDVASKLSSLKSKVEELTSTLGSSVWNSKTVEVSDDSVLGVSVSAYASVGSHTVQVQQLAQAHSITSAGFNKDSLDFTAGDYTFQIKVGDGDYHSISVTIEDTDTNHDVLNKIADAINNTEGLDVSAAVVLTDETNGTEKLVLTSNETGVSNIMSDISDVTGDLAQTLQINGSSAPGAWSAATTIEGQNAIVVLDGNTIERESNTITSIIEGVTLNLYKVQSSDDAPVTFTVERDYEAIEGAIEDFVNTFNDVMTYLNEKTKIDTTTYERGDLAGNTMFTGLIYNLKDIMIEPVTGYEPPEPTMMAEIGLDLQRDGTIVMDTGELDEMLKDHFDSVVGLFRDEDGVATKMQNLIDNYVEGDGYIDAEKEAINDKIDMLDSQIERMNKLLETKEEMYRKQFAMLQEASILYSSQMSMINSFVSSSPLISGSLLMM